MAIYSMGRRRVIVLLILTSILLITLDTRGNAIIDRARSTLSMVLEPFDSAARTIARPVQHAWNGVVNYDELRRENEDLRAEIATQRGAEIEARAAILEYQELLTLNRLLGTGAYPTVTAQVQGERASNFQYTVEINRGSAHGIEVGMPVVNGAGLVGKISRVFPNSAIVLLIIDPEFNIGAKVLTPAESPTTTSPPRRPTESDTASTTTTVPEPTEPTDAPAIGPLDPFDPSVSTTLPPATTVPIPGSNEAASAGTTTTTTVAPPGVATTTTTPADIIRETGTITGQGADQPLLLRFVDDSTTQGRVKVGSPVQTAGGIRSIAPAGIPIGEVGEIRQQTGTRALKVEVKLAAGDLTKLNFVQVLRYSPSSSGG
jgi:rod shape-determining protein MreC